MFEKYGIKSSKLILANMYTPNGPLLAQVLNSKLVTITEFTPFFYTGKSAKDDFCNKFA